MNTHERRRRTTRAVADLVEVVSDILQEAEGAGEGGLPASMVARRAGMGRQWSQPFYETIFGVLGLMAEQGIAEDLKPGRGPASWRLVRGDDPSKEEER